jgi:hypothetical protein
MKRGTVFRLALPPVVEPGSGDVGLSHKFLDLGYVCLIGKRVGCGGQDVLVHEGMSVIAFDEDVDDAGNPDNLIASGVVERPPKWLSCNGSRWVLRIDDNGVRHESDLVGKNG